MKQIFIAFLIIVICLIDVKAQPTKSDVRFLLNTDIARFRYDDNSGYVELYFSIPRRAVTAQKTEERFAGAILLSVYIIDIESEKLTEKTETVIHVGFDTRDEHDEAGNVISQMGFRLRFGEYTVDIIAVDSLNKHRSDTSSHRILIEPYDGIITISDLELCSNIITSPDSDDPFYKNSLIVHPNPSLLFGSSTHPVLFVYSEIYNIIPGRPYYIQASLIDNKGDIVTETKNKRQYDFVNTVELNTLNVTPYPSGRYHYRLSLYSGENELLSSREKMFFLFNPHLALVDRQFEHVAADEISLLSSDEMKNEFRYYRYIATSEDIRTFERLTDDNERRAYLIKFWREAMQGVGEHYPVDRKEYLDRVAYVNERYGVLGREGWQTDRGRVHILYGTPDEIERYPSSGQTKPYEIWRFYQIENGVEFIFIDRMGFGDYTLVHSTKRGELRDSGWRNYLR